MGGINTMGASFTVREEAMGRDEELGIGETCFNPLTPGARGRSESQLSSAPTDYVDTI